MAKPTNDELKQLISNVLSKVTTVEGEVSLLKVDLARLHVAVNYVQSTRMEQAQSSTSGAKGKNTTSPTLATISTSTPHKLHFPMFNGTSDPITWIHFSARSNPPTTTRSGSPPTTWRALPNSGTIAWSTTRACPPGRTLSSLSTSVSGRRCAATRWASSSTSSAPDRCPTTRSSFSRPLPGAPMSRSHSRSRSSWLASATLSASTSSCSVPLPWRTLWDSLGRLNADYATEMLKTRM